ncbi:MAG: hypothetical protein RUMPE_00240 [Eubacteriales bacterium SKADARSKE-1]|nr:hypothetical protein [Eubacteriales bacterium SKADARSKE-1]
MKKTLSSLLILTILICSTGALTASAQTPDANITDSSSLSQTLDLIPPHENPKIPTVSSDNIFDNLMILFAISGGAALCSALCTAFLCIAAIRSAFIRNIIAPNRYNYFPQSETHNNLV